MQEDLLIGIHLYGERVSLDTVIRGVKGRNLVELMEEHGLVTGRRVRDTKRVIDLVWANFFFC